jgi:hypothetical protein
MVRRTTKSVSYKFRITIVILMSLNEKFQIHTYMNTGSEYQRIANPCQPLTYVCVCVCVKTKALRKVGGQENHNLDDPSLHLNKAFSIYSQRTVQTMRYHHCLLREIKQQAASTNTTFGTTHLLFLALLPTLFNKKYLLIYPPDSPILQHPSKRRRTYPNRYILTPMCTCRLPFIMFLILLITFLPSFYFSINTTDNHLMSMQMPYK